MKLSILSKVKNKVTAYAVHNLGLCGIPLGKFWCICAIALTLPAVGTAMDWNDFYQLQQQRLAQQQADYQRQQLEIQQRVLELQQRQYHQQQQWQFQQQQQNRSLPDYTIQQPNFLDSFMQGFEAGRTIQRQRGWNQ